MIYPQARRPAKKNAFPPCINSHNNTNPRASCITTRCGSSLVAELQARSSKLARSRLPLARASRCALKLPIPRATFERNFPGCRPAPLPVRHPFNSTPRLPQSLQSPSKSGVDVQHQHLRSPIPRRSTKSDELGEANRSPHNDLSISPTTLLTRGASKPSFIPSILISIWILRLRWHCDESRRVRYGVCIGYECGLDLEEWFPATSFICCLLGFFPFYGVLDYCEV
jgi:hypothetical protein